MNKRSQRVNVKYIQVNEPQRGWDRMPGSKIAVLPDKISLIDYLVTTYSNLLWTTTTTADRITPIMVSADDDTATTIKKVNRQVNIQSRIKNKELIAFYAIYEKAEDRKPAKQKFQSALESMGLRKYQYRVTLIDKATYELNKTD